MLPSKLASILDRLRSQAPRKDTLSDIERIILAGLPDSVASQMTQQAQETRREVSKALMRAGKGALAIGSIAALSAAFYTDLSFGDSKTARLDAQECQNVASDPQAFEAYRLQNTGPLLSDDGSGLRARALTEITDPCGLLGPQDIPPAEDLTNIEQDDLPEYSPKMR